MILEGLQDFSGLIGLNHVNSEKSCNPVEYCGDYMPTDYLSQAVTAAGILTNQWFQSSTPNDWVPMDYWRTPVICTLLVDLMSQTNQVNYTDTLENARQNGESELTTCGYYDDLTWWGRFFMHTYKYFKQSN